MTAYNILFVGNFNASFTSETHHVKTLHSMGHKVTRLQEGVATAEQILEEGLASDLVVFIHTHGWETPSREGLTLEKAFSKLKKKGIPVITYHLDLWFGLERQKDLEEDSFYKSLSHFFTVDKLMADWFNAETKVKGYYIPAAVFQDEAMRLTGNNFQHQIIFVGSSVYHKEWPYRKQLIDWLKSTYRTFKHIGPGSRYGTVRGMALNRLYSQTKIVIGDSLCINFDYPYYWSDRIYETIGRGGFIIHPYIEGIETQFEDGKEAVFYKYGDFDDLRNKIQHYLINNAEREAIRKAGYERVIREHTYKHRWEEILTEVFKDE